MKLPRHILVPIDFSDLSKVSIQTAVALIQREKGQGIIELLHVLPSKEDSEILDAGKDIEAVLRKRPVEVEMKAWAGLIPADIHCETLTRRGAIPKVIQDLCNERKIDLVVMTTHGRKGLGHILKGSVSEETVRMVTCPILVLHLQKKNGIS